MEKKERMRLWGLRVTKFSPLETLLLGAVVVLGQIFIGFNMSFSAVMFVLGVLLSPILVRLYRNGNNRYGALYALLAVIGTFVISSKLNLEGSFMIRGLYSGFCLLLGTSVAFTVMRARLLRYLQESS